MAVTDVMSLQVFQDGARIEAAFRKYIHRADPDQLEDSYEIIVCHANVIRYFICRSVNMSDCITTCCCATTDLR